MVDSSLRTLGTGQAGSGTETGTGGTGTGTVGTGTGAVGTGTGAVGTVASSKSRFALASIVPVEDPPEYTSALILYFPIVIVLHVI